MKELIYRQVSYLLTYLFMTLHCFTNTHVDIRWGSYNKQKMNISQLCSQQIFFSEIDFFADYSYSKFQGRKFYFQGFFMKLSINRDRGFIIEIANVFSLFFFVKLLMEHSPKIHLEKHPSTLVLCKEYKSTSIKCKGSNISAFQKLPMLS